MQKYTSKKGFTLVEIMIVVVIIGLLAAMAIPAFNRVRATSRANAMDNDARQIGGAAEQYFMENGVSSVTITVSSTGAVSGGTPDFGTYLGNVGGGYTEGTIALSAGGTFTLTHALVNGGTAQTYTAEGHKTATSS